MPSPVSIVLYHDQVSSLSKISWFKQYVWLFAFSYISLTVRTDHEIHKKDISFIKVLDILFKPGYIWVTSLFFYHYLSKSNLKLKFILKLRYPLHSLGPWENFFLKRCPHCPGKSQAAYMNLYPFISLSSSPITVAGGQYFRPLLVSSVPQGCIAPLSTSSDDHHRRYA